MVVPYASSHSVGLLVDNIKNLWRHSEAGENPLEKGAVDRVVCLLEVDKAQTQRHASLPPKFMQPSHREHHV